MLRSLLQKAVRRGYPELAQKVAYQLGHRGDSEWLHVRASIIAFEECWPCANLLVEGTPTIAILRAIAKSIKQKDAAGLGSMAQAAVAGDIDALEMALDPVAVKIVGASLTRPENFFEWVTGQCGSKEQIAIVRVAKNFFHRASFPWDRAFMAAAAYLCVKDGVPEIHQEVEEGRPPFPYWVALDKHTPQGKAALRKVASSLAIPLEQLQWASFYFESAKSQAMSMSPWWECEASWRYKSIRASSDELREMWETAAPYVEIALERSVEELGRLIESVDGDAIF